MEPNPTHVLRGLSRTTGRLMVAPQPTSGLSLAQFRRQAARGFKNKNAQKKFRLDGIRPQSSPSVRIQKKKNTKRPNSAAVCSRKLVTRDKVTGKIVTGGHGNSGTKSKRPSTAANFRRSVDEAPLPYSPGSSTASTHWQALDRPSTAGFHRANPETLGRQRPNSASLSHMRERNRMLEGMTSAIARSIGNSSSKLLRDYSAKKKTDRLAYDKPSISESPYKSGARKKVRPFSAKVGSTPQPQRKRRPKTANLSRGSHLRHPLDAGGSALSAAPANVDSPFLNHSMTGAGSAKPGKRGYTRPWTAGSVLEDSPSRAKRVNASRLMALKKAKQRPQTSVGPRLKTAAYWGDLTKGAGFSSCRELASKVLPSAGADDGSDERKENNIVLGLNEAPDDFKFKVPLHPSSNTMPAEYQEYNLHGRKINKPLPVAEENTLTTLSEEESAAFIPGENKKKVTAFFNADYFALRRKGQGMIRASVVIPHKYIGNAGFTVGHHVESVDAVDYNASDGARLYVTMKPGGDKKLANALKKLCKGEFKIHVTPKQYNPNWSYYPYKGQPTSNPDNVADAVSFVSAEASIFSDKASTMLRDEKMPRIHELTASATKKEIFLNNICSLAQQGLLVKLKGELRGRKEAVLWPRQLDGRTALHCAAVGGQVKTCQFLINAGCSLQKRDCRGKTPYDLACITLKRTEDNHPRIVHFRKCRAMTSFVSIFAAAKNGDFDRVEHIVSGKPAMARSQNAYGMTSMHFAVMKNYVKIAELLSRVGGLGVWECRNNIGQTPLDLAHGNQRMKSLYHDCCTGEANYILNEHAKAYEAHYAALARKQEEKYLKEYLRGTTAAVIRQHSQSAGGIGRERSVHHQQGASRRIDSKNRTSAVDGGKSTASAIGTLPITSTLYKSNKNSSGIEDGKSRPSSGVIKNRQPWWQKPVTNAFTASICSQNAEMPATNSKEFDGYIRGNFNEAKLKTEERIYIGGQSIVVSR